MFHPSEINRIRLVVTRFADLARAILPKPSAVVTKFADAHSHTELRIARTYSGHAFQLEGSFELLDWLHVYCGVVCDDLPSITHTTEAHLHRAVRSSLRTLDWILEDNVSST